MTQVVPAIIPHTKEQIEDEIKRVAKFAKIIQIDITDGIFVPTKTWPYNGRDLGFFEDLKLEKVGWPEWEDVNIEVHLMIKNPEYSVLDWIKTGASTIVAHIEATDNFQEVIDLCKENLVSIGVAIKPSTDISLLEPFITQVDFIQCMGSDMLGKHGVALDEKSVSQIKILHNLYPEHIIAIDIGVNEQTAEELIYAGVTKFISGGVILDADNPEEEFIKLSSYQV
jgi:ribulose-phosphate 3-epimerase